MVGEQKAGAPKQRRLGLNVHPDCDALDEEALPEGIKGRDG